jgi:hypothetical protein
LEGICFDKKISPKTDLKMGDNVKMATGFDEGM